MEAEYNFACNQQQQQQQQPPHKSDAGSNKHLQKYVQQAEQVVNDPRRLIEIICQALESPSIHVFGELLDVTNIRSLANTEYEPYLNLLNIFAYGTYADYRKQKFERPDSLPDLSELMQQKLRHLSIVSLARYRRHISYDVLMKELDIDNVRQLEDMIIQIIYANIIKGTMDQRNNRLEIDETIARDVRPEDYEIITNVLNEWCRTCETILSNIEHQIQQANNVKEDSIRSKQQLETKIQTIRKNLKQSSTDNVVVDDVIMTDMNNVYNLSNVDNNVNNVTLGGGGGGQKTKRMQCRSLKSSFKNSNLNKSWRREN